MQMNKSDPTDVDGDNTNILAYANKNTASTAVLDHTILMSTLYSQEVTKSKTL